MTKPCARCSLDFADEDFYDDICFRCKFKEKEKYVERYACRHCNKTLHRKGLAFCSEGCRDAAKASQKKNHWTKKILSNGQSW